MQQTRLVRGLIMHNKYKISYNITLCHLIESHNKIWVNKTKIDEISKIWKTCKSETSDNNE